MRHIRNIVFIAICIFMFNSKPANALGEMAWCKGLDGTTYPCSYESVEFGWNGCGIAENGEYIFCEPKPKEHNASKKHDYTKEIFISVGVVAVVAVAAWYLFKKKPSENNPGQISLMEF